MLADCSSIENTKEFIKIFNHVENKFKENNLPFDTPLIVRKYDPFISDYSNEYSITLPIVLKINENTKETDSLINVIFGKYCRIRNCNDGYMVSGIDNKLLEIIYFSLRDDSYLNLLLKKQN